MILDLVSQPIHASVSAEFFNIPAKSGCEKWNVDLEHAADWGQMTGHSEVAGTSSDQYRQTRQGLGMSLRAFRGGNPHERLVAIPDPNLLRACRPTLCMIKHVIIRIYKRIVGHLSISLSWPLLNDPAGFPSNRPAFRPFPFLAQTV